MLVQQTRSLALPQASQTPSAVNNVYNLSQSNQWGPEAVSNIVFGCIMAVIGVLALWQSRLHLIRKSQLKPLHCCFS